MRHVHRTTLLPMLAAALAVTACEQAGPTAPATAPGRALRAQRAAQPPDAQGYTTTYRESLDGEVWFNECTGELVELTGTIHGVVHLSPNGDGGFRHVGSYNAAGVKGVGLTTGVRYVGINNDNFSINLLPGSEGTATFTLRFIGRGSAVDFSITSVSRIRLETDGSLTFLRDRVSFDCR